jgi:integrase
LTFLSTFLDQGQKHIDWQRHTVSISESLSRAPDGRTAGYARQAKATKNQKVRVIDLHPDLYIMLQGRFTPGAKPDDLVFTTVNGVVIDYHNFSQRTWRDLCKAAGIEYRVPYAARHSLGSHLLENGATIPQAAAILGNRPETLARYYAHAINRPDMPGF